MNPGDDPRAPEPDGAFERDDALEYDGTSGAAVAALRTGLESIDDVPVTERVAVFEAANATLTAALAELDEV